MQRAKKIVEGYDRKHLDGGQEVESRDIGARTGESPMQYAWCMHAGSFHSGLHTSSCATIYRGDVQYKINPNPNPIISNLYSPILCNEIHC